jgi:hypothetical protein
VLTLLPKKPSTKINNQPDRRAMRAGILGFGLLVAVVALGQEPYIDKGACPGEGCGYGERWVTETAIQLRGAPGSSSTIVATLERAEPVATITSEVHTIPVRFIVRRAHEEFVPGDEVIVYTYLGEGRFRLRHNGKLKEVDLDFSPAGSSNGTRCDVEARCWGTLEKEHESQWWVKVRTRSGLEGWVLDTAGFRTPQMH